MIRYASVEVKPNGFLGGGQIGCNYQFATNWVAGIDGDFSWADVKGNTIDPYFTNKNFHSKTDFLATATGRLGFAWDRWMVYGKGGVAWADDKYNLISGSTDASVGEHRTGWTAGVGVEWAFWDNWSVKVEYDHYGFGSRRVVFATGGYVTNIPADVDQRIDVVKAGINYRFNWGAPPPGRY